MARRRESSEEAPEQEAGEALRNLRRIVAVLQRRSRAVEGKVGISAAEAWALREVASAPGGLAVGALARRLALHKANATRVVDRLEARGLVTRQRSAEDRRIVVAQATPAGRAVTRRAPGAAQADLLRQLEGLPRAERRAISRALGRLAVLLGIDRLEPPPMFIDDRPARG